MDKKVLVEKSRTLKKVLKMVPTTKVLPDNFFFYRVEHVWILSTFEIYRAIRTIDDD